MMSPRTLRTRVLLPIFLFALGCNAAPSADNQAEPAEPVEPTSDGEATDAAPVIACDEPTHDFGTIAPAEKVKHVFKLVNRGNADLKIEKVERT
jgi:hypothetical protein